MAVQAFNQKNKFQSLEQFKQFATIKALRKNQMGSTRLLVLWVVGHQFGQGDGKTAMTILGVLGGAMVGSQVNQNSVPVSMQEISIQMPDGKVININVEGQGFVPGQHVEIKTNGKTAEIKAI